MIVSISQPAYLPWLGYFNRIARSNVHIVLDDVQIERGTSFTNRNKIRTPNGWAWLTIPILRGDTPEGAIINNVQIDGSHWAKKHLRSLIQSYSQTPHFANHRGWLEDFYSKHWTHLAPLLREETGYFLNALEIKTRLVFSSEMNVDGQKSDLILNLCKAVGATTYLSGPFGRHYLNASNFEDAGIGIEFHDYIHPVYSQCQVEFMSHLSVVDLLFNHGGESLAILRCDG
jgi:hypothetical protein